MSKHRSVAAKEVLSSSIGDNVLCEVLCMLNKECQLISKNKLLELQTLDQLTNFQIDQGNWLNQAPLLNRVLAAIVNEKKKEQRKIKKNKETFDFLCAKQFIGFCLLFCRSQRNSLFQYVIGLMMDQGGLTNEVYYT